MCLQSGFWVSAAIVHDEVDDLTLGYALIEQVEEEGEEDCLGAFLGDHPQHLAGVDEKTGGETGSAVTLVLELPPGELARAAYGEVRKPALQDHSQPPGRRRRPRHSQGDELQTVARYTDRCAVLGRLARSSNWCTCSSLSPRFLDACRSTSRVIEDG